MTLLAPSLSALKEMVKICVDYAIEYKILFNAAKSKLIIFKCNKKFVSDPKIAINNDIVNVVNKVEHLGHILNENINNTETSKCIGDFNRQCNLFLAKYKYATSNLRNILFHKYCSNFYGTQILPIYDRSIDEICKAWRVAIRRVWRIPWRTHSRLLPHLAGVMDPKLWFEKRATKFARSALNHNNVNVKNILHMGSRGAYSIFGGNVRHLESKFNFESKNIDKIWQDNQNSEDARIAHQIIELCSMRDNNAETQFSRHECDIMINSLCTD